MYHERQWHYLISFLAFISHCTLYKGISSSTGEWTIKDRMNECACVCLHAATNGIVLAAEKKVKSIRYDESTISKIESASDRIGLTYSGMGPDFRVLVQRAQRIAEAYRMEYKDPIPVSQLVQKVAYVMQEYTQSR